MEGISDIKIVALDAKRPPVVRKAPYIDLFFELSHKAPKVWCEDFNGLLSKYKFPAKVQPDPGLFIETWVRTPDDVAPHLEHLKLEVAECNERYIENVRLAQGRKDGENAATAQGTGEQGRLNRIVAGLLFDS